MPCAFSEWRCILSESVFMPRRIRKASEMRAIVISVGTELLIGTTLNTHGQFLSQTLNAVGISVLMHISVGDNSARIQSAASSDWAR